MSSCFQFLYNLICGPPPPPPPPASYYGFRWVPGNGAPGTLDPAALAIIGPGAAGLYIGFQQARLEPGFLRWAGQGPIAPVFDYPASPFMPAAPAPAVTALIAQLRANPPQDEPWNISARTQLDLTAFLRYATWCLNLINQTAAGNAQLTALRTRAQQVIVAPFSAGNNAVALVPGQVRNAVARTLFGFDQSNVAPIRVAIRAAIDLQYAALGAGLPRYNQFAADINTMPLYSTFVDEGAFVANFLQNNYLYLGAPITGLQLMTWLSDGGMPLFENWLLTNTLVTGVNLRRCLFQAMTIALLDNSVAGAGSTTIVGWQILNEGMNLIGDPDWRPPAIGLAHELMHAYYNGAGGAPGYDDNNFSSTATELQATGIIPFNGNAISENRVRAQWAGVNNPAPDPTNTNAAVIPRRTVYTPPVLPQTVVSLRNNGQRI